MLTVKCVNTRQMRIMQWGFRKIRFRVGTPGICWCWRLVKRGYEFGFEEAEISGIFGKMLTVKCVNTRQMRIMQWGFRKIRFRVGTPGICWCWRLVKRGYEFGFGRNTRDMLVLEIS
ncbi:hypothetical protein QE152_g19052 [Popillia japonica]|uniref:Uncharacterized protein n=1 Tax=Popillia japonica TaxID=7064 RepID=A0AAW1L3Q3_POPJA